MGKTYIFWWALSAFSLFIAIAFLINGIMPNFWSAIFWFVVLLYVGYRRYVRYQEWQYDRNKFNDYLDANTPKKTDEEK